MLFPTKQCESWVGHGSHQSGPSITTSRRRRPFIVAFVAAAVAVVAAAAVVAAVVVQWNVRWQINQCRPRQ